MCSGASGSRLAELSDRQVRISVCCGIDAYPYFLEGIITAYLQLLLRSQTSTEGQDPIISASRLQSQAAQVQEGYRILRSAAQHLHPTSCCIGPKLRIKQDARNRIAHASADVSSPVRTSYTNYPEEAWTGPGRGRRLARHCFRLVVACVPGMKVVISPSVPLTGELGAGRGQLAPVSVVGCVVQGLCM